jgi:cold shock CspA family protein
MNKGLLVGLAAGASLLVPGCGGGGGGGAGPSAAPTLLDVRPAAVRHLVVTAGAQQAAFTQATGRVWRAGQGASDEGAALLLGAEERLFPLRGYRRMRVDGRDPAFGLIAPAATLTVDTGRGPARTVVIGAATFNGGGFYARLGGTDDVFLVARSVLADLRSLAEGRAVMLPQVEDARIKQVLDDNAGPVAHPAADGPWVRQAVDAGATLPEARR